MKVAIVGCGGIGLAHARAYGQIAAVEVGYLVDRDIARAQGAAGECGGEALGDISELPDDVRIASVATAPSSHAALSEALMKRGIAVFCEKPLGMTADEARSLLCTSACESVPLSVGFKMRYEPVFARARELASELGPIVQIATTKMQPYSPRAVGEWRPSVGAMVELSVHDFDLVSFVTGLQPERVHAAQLSFRLGWEREDGFSALVQYEDGVQAALTGCYTLESTWQGADFSLSITGEKGYLRALRGDRIVLHTDRYQSIEVEAPGNTFVAELNGFVEAVRDGAEPPIPAQAGAVSTTLIEAIWVSGQERRAVELGEV